MVGNWSPNESEMFSAAMNADGHGLPAALQFKRREMCRT